MTNKEAVLAVTGTLVSADSIQNNGVDKALTDLGLYTEGYYIPANAAKIDFASIEVLNAIVAGPDITEGGMTIKYDRPSILKFITALGIKNGIVAYLPLRKKVKAISPW